MKRGRKFPTFWVIVLVLASGWLLNELELIALNLPWLPVIIVVWAIGAIVNHYK